MPECVWVAEESLQMDPLHKFPALDTDSPAGVLSNEFDAVESLAGGAEVAGPDKEPFDHFHQLLWMRWKMAQEPDFKMEKNILEKIAETMGFKLWFLPKFHCDF